MGKHNTDSSKDSDDAETEVDFLARARAKGRALLEERGVITTDGS